MFDATEHYGKLFSDLQSLIYTDYGAFDTYFDDRRYVPGVSVFTDKGVVITGYQERGSDHIILYAWDRLQVYDRDGDCVFSVVVEP